MKLIYIGLLLLFAFCNSACAQEGADWTSDRYFIESTDTFSVHGPDHITRDVLQDINGTYWFATWKGIVSYDGKRFTNHTLKDKLIHFHVVCCYADKKGSLWFGTARGGVYRYDGTSFKLFTRKDNGLIDNNISCIMEDRAGNMWFGAETGVSRYDGTKFTSFTNQDVLAGKYINAMMQDKAGKIWVGASDGISCYDGKSFTAFTGKNGQPFKKVTALFQDKTGKIWIGRMDGLTMYDGKSFTDTLSNFLTYYFTEDKAGNVWFTHSEPNTQNSNLPSQVLYRYDGKDFAKIIEKDKPNDFQLFGKTVDRDGNTWFGTMHGPCRYDGKTFTSF